MAKSNQIKQYWNEQAKIYEDNLLATMPDQYLKNLEVENIAKCLRDGLLIADVGCGNGYTLFQLAQMFPKSQFIGIDYSETMIFQAQKTLDTMYPGLKQRLRFEVGDVIKLNLDKPADIIFTDRCLINLPTASAQKIAVEMIAQNLKKMGVYVLCEDFQDSLDNLNEVRRSIGLELISTRWHNLYLNTNQIQQSVERYYRLIKELRFSSLYYLASRVIYAKIAAEGKETPDYLHPINNIASQISSITDTGDYGPLKIWICQRK